jgi:membrane protease YdiL (CAAX protease family)
VSNGAEPSTVANLVTDATILVGIALFAGWLARTSLGRRSLVGSKPRRHRLAPLALFVPFVLWFIGPILLQPLARLIVGPAEDWRQVLALNVDYCIASLGAVAVALVLVRLNFVRGLKGWGLRPRTIPKDLGLAFVNLLAVWPLVMAMIVLVLKIGRLLQGPDYEIPQHEELQVIITSTHLSLQVLTVVLAIVIAPLVEELLFRGLFQTMIRSYVGRPWLSIVLASVVFATVHQNPEHWPALFMLALGLGYAYEKSGSLFRPIFMHALFNGLTIASALSEAARV